MTTLIDSRANEHGEKHSCPRCRSKRTRYSLVGSVPEWRCEKCEMCWTPISREEWEQDE